MPGLKQAERIANDRLKEHLNKYGYHPCPHTPALWTHKSRNITFALLVDNLDVKYVNVDHLAQALRDQYEITVNNDGKFLGLTNKLDYANKTVNISMPGYVKKALLRFQHIARRKQQAPHQWNQSVYGRKTQFTPKSDTIAHRYQSPAKPSSNRLLALSFTTD